MQKSYKAIRKLALIEYEDDKIEAWETYLEVLESSEKDNLRKIEQQEAALARERAATSNNQMETGTGNGMVYIEMDAKKRQKTCLDWYRPSC
ncbi:MAG: hypothetical protein LBE13_03935 [Bacteroidales bacterium]|nr:hypothetical protein [Bacteroidales bacterium]